AALGGALQLDRDLRLEAEGAALRQLEARGEVGHLAQGGGQLPFDRRWVAGGAGLGEFVAIEAEVDRAHVEGDALVDLGDRVRYGGDLGGEGIDVDGNAGHHGAEVKGTGGGRDHGGEGEGGALVGGGEVDLSPGVVGGGAGSGAYHHVADQGVGRAGGVGFLFLSALCRGRGELGL